MRSPGAKQPTTAPWSVRVAYPPDCPTSLGASRITFRPRCRYRCRSAVRRGWTRCWTIPSAPPSAPTCWRRSRPNRRYSRTRCWRTIRTRTVPARRCRRRTPARDGDRSTRAPRSWPTSTAPVRFVPRLSLWHAGVNGIPNGRHNIWRRCSSSQVYFYTRSRSMSWWHSGVGHQVWGGVSSGRLLVIDLSTGPALHLALCNCESWAPGWNYCTKSGRR